MAYLDTLLKKSTRRTSSVTLPARGEIKLRSLYESEKVNQYENWFYNKKGQPIEGRIQDIRIKLIVLCVYDEDPDVQVLTDDHISVIRESWSAAEVSAVYEECSKLTKDNADELEGELKNFGSP